jgi:cold shock CspA family protein
MRLSIGPRTTILTAPFKASEHRARSACGEVRNRRGHPRGAVKHVPSRSTSTPLIVSDWGGKDIFVHASALERSGIMGLDEGQRVAVDVAAGQKGPEAVNLRLDTLAMTPSGFHTDHLYGWILARSDRPTKKL